MVEMHPGPMGGTFKACKLNDEGEIEAWVGETARARDGWASAPKRARFRCDPDYPLPTRLLTVINKPWAYAIEAPVNYDAKTLTEEDARHDLLVRRMSADQAAEVVQAVGQAAATGESVTVTTTGEDRAEQTFPDAGKSAQ